MFFGSQKKDIIGVDIGSNSVKLVQLHETKGVYHLTALGVAPLPSDAIVDGAIMDSSAVVEVIDNLYKSLKLKTKNVATSISGHSVIIRKIKLPIMTEEEMEASIQWEAEQYIPFEISEVNLDFQILGPDAKDTSQMNVVLVAAKKDFVNDYISVFSECGLTPIVLDIDCFAMENAFEVNSQIDSQGVIALVNMGASSINMNVLKDGASIFTRDITVGGNMVNEELQKRLGLSAEDAEALKLGGTVDGIQRSAVDEVIREAMESLVQEVQRSLDFFSATASDDKIQAVYITGGVSRNPLAKELLSERLALPVDVLGAFGQVVIDEKNFDLEYIDAIGPLMSVAVGLAMRRLGDK
ncbi:MAG: type IV pilus assembly protein PilM [Desulfuromonadales bacterium]|nr:type IV pilus assembly protein PilM [Desulfuromonadales bacterium]